RLVGKPGYGRVLDVGQDQSLVTAEGLDVGDLALEVDVVFGIDLQMHRDRWVNGRQFRPDAAKLGPADLRIGQQLKGRAAVAVPVQRESVPRRLVRRH